MEKFRHQYRVTYSDCTVGNHVYYARYLDILEEVRGEFFRHTGIAFSLLQGLGVVFPVIEARLKYKAPARYDDVLNCDAWITRANGVRLNFAYQVEEKGGRIILQGETWHTCAGLDEKPKRLPEDVIAAINPYIITHQPVTS